MHDNDSCAQWLEAAAAGTYDPLSDERINEMWMASQRHGPPACWTGTNGTLASMIRELLRDREHLSRMLAWYQERHGA